MDIEPLGPPPGPLTEDEMAVLRAKTAEIKARARRAEWWCAVQRGLRERAAPFLASKCPHARANGRKILASWPTADQIPQDLR